MKNKYLFKLFLLAIPLVSLVFMSTSIGVYGAYSGSPGDGNSCAFCHSGGNFDASLAITTNIPVTGYEFDTYMILLSHLTKLELQITVSLLQLREMKIMLKLELLHQLKVSQR
jgi:hypothetical protein